MILLPATVLKRAQRFLHAEHSLGEVKDVVRRKLGLGRETDVSLKQMRPDALLDLEDGKHKIGLPKWVIGALNRAVSVDRR